MVDAPHPSRLRPCEEPPLISWLSMAFASIAAACTPAKSASPSPPDVMVIGTVHKGHMLIAGYPDDQTRRRARRVQAGSWCSSKSAPKPSPKVASRTGPAEMTYVTVLARQLGIPVEPIDWYRDQDVGAEPPHGDPADEATYDRDFAAIEAKYDRLDTFEAIHSPERMRALLRVSNAKLRYGVDPFWARRQAWFHARADHAITDHHAHRVAAFVGATHLPELQMYLEATGGHVVSPLSLSLPPTHDDAVPAAVIESWARISPANDAPN